MRLTHCIAVAACLAAPCAWPQPHDDDPPEYRDHPQARDAYRRGFERGFERGYDRGLREGEKRGAAVVAPPPPPPPKPVPNGPIKVSGAFYGTSSKNCDATRWLGHRANGKRTYSVEVTNAMCGDPARGDRKQLEVTYWCGSLSRTASAYEHRTIYLDCN
jgi:hypothetical protein